MAVQVRTAAHADGKVAAIKQFYILVSTYSPPLQHSSLGKTPNDQLIDLVRKATELFMTKLHPGSNLTLVAAPDGIPRDCPRPVIAAMARLEVGNGRWGISNR